MAEIRWIGLKELKAAVNRSPQKVLDEARRFLTRGIAAYKRGIIRAPWRIGGTGGGAPVKTGHLRDTHFTRIDALQAVIGPDLQAAPYAKYVHHGTRMMQGRPWLEYVKSTQNPEIENLYRDMLKNIVGDLAK